MSGTRTPLLVFARLRPLLHESISPLDYEIQPSSDGQNNRSLLRIFGADRLQSFDFLFDDVFDESATQEQVYQRVAAPIVDSFLLGYNGCVFCYGMTSSGKTFTTAGSTQFHTRGIIPRALYAIFDRVKTLQTSGDLRLTIAVSFLEIYNEAGYDLLANTANLKKPIEQWPRVEVLEDAEGRMHLRNLTKHQVTSVDQALDLFVIGNSNRMVSSTPMNEASSRSHCVWTVEFEHRQISTSKLRRSKFHIVDLAGSERAWKSQLADEALSEAKYINKSLHFLERVITSLVKKKNTSAALHVPYRNSLLTSVLKESLGGNSRTAMIANLATETNVFGESLATARFAPRCGQLKNDCVVNEAVDWKDLSERLMEENRSLMGKIKAQNDRSVRMTEADSSAALLGIPTLPMFQAPSIVDPDFAGNLSIRETLTTFDINLAKKPRETRKRILAELLDKGVDFRFSSAVDLCVVTQLLLAKLEQTAEEKRQLKVEYVQSNSTRPSTTHSMRN